MTFTKRFLNYKVLTVVFLFFSLVGSVYLVQLVQENRGQAKKGEKSAYDLKREREEEAKNKKKQEEQDKANQNITSKYRTIEDCYAEKGKKTCDQAFNPDKSKATEMSYATAQACNDNGGAWCGTCGGFCISLGGGGSCDQAGIDKCNEYPQRGASYATSADATHKYKCSCSGKPYYFDKPGVCNFSGGKAESVTIEASGAYNNEYSGYKGTDNDGLCHIIDFTSSGKKNTYYCKNKFYGQDDLSTGCQEVASVDLSCFCGTVQIDTGNGFESKTMKCGCAEKKTVEDTPTPPLTTITSSPTATPTIRITNTPTSTPTSTSTVTPTNTPTNTPTPTNTLTPTPTPTGVWLSPTPTPTRVSVTSGPSPTRIILPNSGVEFPIQILTIAGVITTLVGFLILL